MRLSSWLPAAAAALAAAQTESTTTKGSPDGQFEIDIVFPRNNQTYKMADVFPIVFAIQNVSALRSMAPNITIHWGFHPNWPRGYYGNLVDEGKFSLSDLAELDGDEDSSTGQPLLLVAATNATSWIHRIEEPGHRIDLQWAVRAWNTSCDDDASTIWGGYYRFLVARAWGDHHPDAHRGPILDPVVTPTASTTPAPGADDGNIETCPDPVGVYQVGRNATDPACGIATQLFGLPSWHDGPIIDAAKVAQPCNVKIDEAKASSIMSQASALVTAAASPTSEDWSTWTPSSTGAAPTVGPASPVQTAFAAAVVLGGLML
ncbi:hypothetical protein VTJ83DRAFT_2448 [Remersonia thermophila]|uniref:DUF7136 domain-containing protein n=1 Tax=Remersonia thermophila TaxID=72144 RepID=A0ABR4DIW5_9PEZI